MSTISPKGEQSSDEETDLLTGLNNLAISPDGQFIRKINSYTFENALPISINETDPVFSYWLINTPPLYSEIDPVWIADKPNYLTIATASTTYVPYTGANADVDLGTHNITTTGTATLEKLIVDTDTLFIDSVNHRVGIGTASPAYILDIIGTIRTQGVDIKKDGNFGTGFSILNAGTGVLSNESFYLGESGSGGKYGGMNYFNNSYTPNGLLLPNSTWIYGANTGGLTLMAYNAAGVIRFATGGTGTAYERMKILANGNIGINTTAPDKKLEINSADGNNLRLTYNDTNGSATAYTDILTTSGGDLTITPSGGDIGIGTANLATTGALKGVHKAADGTSAVADGTYTTGIGGTTNGTITIKDGIITAIQEAVA
jgi:hypothetical protein